MSAVSLTVMEPQLRGVTNKNPLQYRVDEQIDFLFTLEDDAGLLPQKCFFAWTREGDDAKTAHGVLPLAKGETGVLPFSVGKPGFIFVHGVLQDINGRELLCRDGRPVTFYGGAGAAPDRIPCSAEPADFDAFWQKQLDKLAAVPIRADFRELDIAERETIFTVSADCAGPRPATAFMAIPLAAPRGSCDICVHFDGYGFDLPKYQNQLKLSPGDAIHLYVNAHGAELMADRAYYLDLNRKIKHNKQMYAFSPEQNRDPETAYFLQMVWRALRIIEVSRAVPEWNGRNLICEGISQGGLQAVWCAALSPYVTEIRASIPWNCDVAGTHDFQRLFGPWRIPYVPGREYFDCVNMARRIHCPVDVVRAGLGDYICPPSGVHLFYRELKCPKKIRWFQGATHSSAPRFPDTYSFAAEAAG